MQFTQNAIRPGFYRINEEMREYTRDKIAGYCDGTRKALKAGLSIPILDIHDFSGDPSCGPTRSKKATSGLGWITGVIHHKDGSMSHKLNVTDSEAARKIKNGSIRYTSPQFLDDFTDGDGVHYGPIVRHVALTPTPRTKNQGPIVADAGPLNAISFSEDDYLGSTIQEAETAMASFAEDETKPETKDDLTDKPEETPGPDAEMAPDIDGEKDTESSTAQLVMKIQEVMGIDVVDTNDVDAVLTAVLNFMRAGAVQEAKDKAELQPQVEEQVSTTSFSEEQQPIVDSMLAEIASLKAVNHTKSTAVGRGTLTQRIKGSRVPPKMKTELLQHAGRTSFSEDGREEGVLTITQVLNLIEKTIPDSVSFDEDQVVEEEHPEGAAFTAKPGEDTFTDEEHKEAARDQMKRSGHYKESLQPA